MDESQALSMVNTFKGGILRSDGENEWLSLAFFLTSGPLLCGLQSLIMSEVRVHIQVLFWAQNTLQTF